VKSGKMKRTEMAGRLVVCEFGSLKNRCRDGRTYYALQSFEITDPL
jgi:hypothetical protein